jgi:replicative DNA helicase
VSDLDEDFAVEWSASEAVIAAEMAVVGAAIQSRHALEEALDVIQPSDVYSVSRYAFEAAVALLNRGEPINPAAVLVELQATGRMQQIDGPYLARLIECAAVAGQVKYLAEKVANDAARRTIRAGLRRGIQVADNPAWDASTDIDMIRKLVDDAVVRRVGERPTNVAQEMIQLLDALENPPAAIPGIVPPFKDMEGLVKTFRAGQLVVIAARPGLGKSVLATDIARKAAIHDGNAALFISVEMPKDELLARITAAEAKVPLHAIRSYDVTPDQLRRVSEAGARISGAPLVIDYKPGATLEHIRSQLRWMSRSGDLGLCVVDYLQILRAPKAARRDLELGVVTQELKQMAGEFGIPIFLLSQLNRGPEARSDKRPGIGDLRDSGSIESDADIVILIHREDAYERESPRAGEADLIVAKNRNGPQATVTVAFQGHYSRFVDMADPVTRVSAPDRPNLHKVQ